MTDLATSSAVRQFWLEELTVKDWYVAKDTVDDMIRDRFLTVWQAAHDGGCQDWLKTADDLLAYVILTDQFPRNMFRGDARSFATDAQAVQASQIALGHGWDLQIPAPQRQFIYVTLMHAEDIALQDRAVDLIASRMPEGGAGNINHAKAHRWVIAEFGRFPYRNDALGRDTTPPEQRFLDAGGYRFALQKFPE